MDDENRLAATPTSGQGYLVCTLNMPSPESLCYPSSTYELCCSYQRHLVNSSSEMSSNAVATRAAIG